MKSRKKLCSIVVIFVTIAIFSLSILMETLLLKKLTEDDYDSLIDYSDYIIRTTYLNEDMQSPNWNYIVSNKVKVTMKNNFDDDEEEKSKKSTIQITLSLPKHYQELTVTYPYILDADKNELIIGIDYKYVEKHYKNDLGLIALLITVLINLLFVMFFEVFNLKKTSKI